MTGGLIHDPDGNASMPLPGMGAGTITQAEWHALLNDLLELERAGALGGIRAIIAGRLRQVRGGRPGGSVRAFIDAAADDACLEPRQRDTARRMILAAALLAAEIDQEAG